MYGMDNDGDGMVDFAELQAYEKFKAEKLAEAKALAAAAEAAKAEAKAANESQYDTVPGFAARRGWHGNAMNEHNYAEPLKKEDAVFAYNALSKGPMAQLLARPASTTAGAPMEPRGRARTQGGGGIEGPVAYYEPDPLASQ